MVVDCSVLIDAVVGPDLEAVQERLRGEHLVAPFLVDHEFVSTLRRLVLGNHVDHDRARDALDDFDQLPITRWRFAHDLRHRALDLRDNISAYDASYVALAESVDRPLMTRDTRLATAAEHLVEVIVV